MVKSSWSQAESDQNTMPMHVSVPDGPGPFPGILVMQHQGGVDDFIQRMTQRLAEAGFVAAAPDLYHRDGPDCRDDIVTRRSRLRDRNIITDVNASVRFLQQHRAVDGHRLGIIGFCMGGRIVYLMAAASTAFKAAVAYYPGHLFRPWGKDLPSPFERTADIRCPIQGHFGADDKNPSPDDMRQLEMEMEKLNKTHEFYQYLNAGHAFMDSTKESYRLHADDTSWPRMLTFLKEHLQP